MGYVLLGLLGMVIAGGLVWLLLNVDARVLARSLRYVLGGALVALGGILSLAGRFGLGIPFIGIGVVAMTRGRIGRFDLGGSRRSGGQRSTVRSRLIEAELDHDSGRMTGRVVAGEYAGRGLDDLAVEELMGLYGEADGDADSRALLEAYLDRRIPGWRENGEADAAAGPGSAADAGGMTDEEAYQVLGLAAGASDAEIRAAHRRLMMGVHPDHGGSTFLAARINEAKDRLLGKH